MRKEEKVSWQNSNGSVKRRPTWDTLICTLEASDIVVSAWSDDAQRRALHLRQEAEELKRKLQHAEAPNN